MSLSYTEINASRTLRQWVKATSHRVRRNDYTPPCVQLVLRSHYQQQWTDDGPQIKSVRFHRVCFYHFAPDAKESIYMEYHACMLSGVRRRPRERASERHARLAVSSVCLSLSGHESASFSFLRFVPCLASCMHGLSICARVPCQC